MARKYQNFISGTLSVAHSSTETLMQSPGLASVMAVSGSDHLTIVINPEGDETYSPGPEIVHLISHVSGAQTAEIVRGQQGTSAKAHALNTPWVAATTADDWLRVDALQAQMTVMQAEGWVTSNRIANAAVDRHKLSQGLIAPNSGLSLIDGQLSTVVDGLTIESSLSGLRVREQSINTQHLANLAVTQGKIASGAVTADKLATGSVTTEKLAGGVIAPGIIWMTAASFAPSGWLLCDGSPVSRTQFPELFAQIGETYGAGDGVNTFNLPNLKGRVPVGLDVGQSEFNALAKADGTKRHTLTQGEMPSHSHSMVAAGAHTHEYANGELVGTSLTAEGWIERFFENPPGNAQSVEFANKLHTQGSHVHTLNSSGSGQSHNNLQPYIVVNFIIKT